MSKNTIFIKGAREHNLKNIDIEIPRDKLVVFTGLSGSGKSSLAFDTIYAEGQRRYVESLSSYARQFLGQMDKPDVDYIDGLSPAISIDQKTTSKNPRSTVGTVTEIYDYLRLLYARIGVPHCPICGREILQQTIDQIVDQIMTLPQGEKIQVLAPVVRARKGEHVKEAGPAMPVEILGLSGTPSAGDRFAVVENESRAREISEYRQRLTRDKAVARHAGQRGSLEQMMTQLQSSGMKEFPLVIKGDVQGSIEAIAGALDKLGTDEVRARIVHSGAGGITESDISLAEASNAAIIGFNVRANVQARQAAERAGIEIRYYNIIYDLVDDVKAAMSGLLSPERRETFLGNAEILEVFNITKTGKVAGCRVTEGKVERGVGVRLVRDNVVIHEGKLKTLKRFKDEVSEVNMGQECGMAFENYEDIRAGDTIECFRVEHITRTL